MRIRWRAGNGYGRRVNIDQICESETTYKFVHWGFQEAMAAVPSLPLRATMYGLQSLEEGEHWGVGGDCKKNQETTIEMLPLQLFFPPEKIFGFAKCFPVSVLMPLGGDQHCWC